MLDFEKIDGFVVDLRTPKSILNELKYVLDSEEDRNLLLSENTIYEIRDFILDYYINTDNYVFCKKLNVYQVCETELYTEDEYLELQDDIGNLTFSQNRLIEKLNDVAEKKNKFFYENCRNKTLLYNAITLLEDDCGIDNAILSIEDTNLLDKLGMTMDEYNNIMKGE